MKKQNMSLSEKEKTGLGSLASNGNPGLANSLSDKLHRMYIGTGVAHGVTFYKIFEFTGAQSARGYRTKTLTKDEAIQQIDTIENLEYDKNKDKIGFNGISIEPKSYDISASKSSQFKNMHIVIHSKLVIIIAEAVDKKKRHLGYYACVDTERRQGITYIDDAQIMALLHLGCKFQNVKIKITNRLKVCLLDINGKEINNLVQIELNGMKEFKDLRMNTDHITDEICIDFKIGTRIFTMNPFQKQIVSQGDTLEDNSIIITDIKESDALYIDEYIEYKDRPIVIDKTALGCKMDIVAGELFSGYEVMTKSAYKYLSKNCGLHYDTDSITTLEITENKIPEALKKLAFLGDMRDNSLTIFTV